MAGNKLKRRWEGISLFGINRGIVYLQFEHWYMYYVGYL